MGFWGGVKPFGRFPPSKRAARQTRGARHPYDPTAPLSAPREPAPAVLSAHDKPEILKKVFRRLMGADRILLSFADPAERMRWAQIMRLTGLDAEVLEPRLEEVAPLGLRHWGSVPTLVVSRSPLRLEERALKRAFDLTLVIMAAPLIAPLGLVREHVNRLGVEGGGIPLFDLSLYA